MDHYYWDACVFLSYISNEVGRADIVEAMLEDCQRGDISISTSALTVAEVAYAALEKDKKVADPTIERRIETLWLPATRINLVDVYPVISRDARALMRQGLSLSLIPKPPDAIHLATAKKIGAKEVHSYDRLQKYTVLAGLPVKEPYLFQSRLTIPMQQGEIQVERTTEKIQNRPSA